MASQTFPVLGARVIIPIHVSTTDKDERREFKALIDTGSQITLVSSRLVASVNPMERGVGGLIGITGKSKQQPKYWLRVTVPLSQDSLSHTLVTLLVPEDQPEFDLLLGMDLLTRFDITMRNNQFTISDPDSSTS